MSLGWWRGREDECRVVEGGGRMSVGWWRGGGRMSVGWWRGGGGRGVGGRRGEGGGGGGGVKEKEKNHCGPMRV